MAGSEDSESQAIALERFRMEQAELKAWPQLHLVANRLLRGYWNPKIRPGPLSLLTVADACDGKLEAKLCGVRADEINALADALADVWQRLQLPLNERALAASGSKSFESKLGPAQNWSWHTSREGVSWHASPRLSPPRAFCPSALSPMQN